MFNLQPGQGLGFTGSELIAYGLGSGLAPLVEEQPVPEYRGGGQHGDVWDLQDLALERRREFLMKEDEEIFEMILQFILSEVSE